MTKRERETRFNELTSTHSVRSMAELVIQLEEHCEKKDREVAKLRSKIQSLESGERR